MSAPEYLCFEIDVPGQPVSVIVSDTTLRASFASAQDGQDLRSLYERHREALHAAALRRARSSPWRPVVLRATDLG